jgi:hypothetical protein
VDAIQCTCTRHSRRGNTAPSALPQQLQGREDCAPLALILYVKNRSVHAAPGQARLLKDSSYKKRRTITSSKAYFPPPGSITMCYKPIIAQARVIPTHSCSMLSRSQVAVWLRCLPCWFACFSQITSQLVAAMQCTFTDDSWSSLISGLKDYNR